MMVLHRMNLCGSGLGKTTCPCEDSNELLGSLKCG